MTSVQIDVAGRGGPAARPPGPRAAWHLRANAVVLGWLGLAVAAVAAGDALPAPRWLPIHVFLLGAVTSAILIWSEHFAVTLLHAPPSGGRRRAAVLACANAGVAAVLYGATAGPWQVAAAGAAAVCGAVVWHVAAMLRMRRRALPGPFAHILPWYAVAGAMFVVGGALGGLLVAHAGSAALHERLQAAHIHVNLFGWVGLTVLGTLFTLWPTVLRTRVSPLTRRCSRAAFGLVVPGLSAGAAALALGLRWIAVAGLAAYAAGVIFALAPSAETVRRRRPHTPAGWMIAAGVVWFEVALVADLAIVASRPAERVADTLAILLPLVLVGFVAQTLLGSLTHLLPAILGGGPSRLKENAALLGRGWKARLVAVNAGVPLTVSPVPDAVRAAGWVLVLAPVAVFVVLAVAALARTRAAGHAPAPAAGPARPGPPAVDSPEAPSAASPETAPPPGGSRRPGSRLLGSPAFGGVLAGCLLTAAAVLVAADDGSAPASRTVVAGAERAVEVTLVGMSIRPSTIEAAPGTRLTLRVINEDAQHHDLRLSTGERTPLLGPGESHELRLEPLTGPIDGWCTVVGHRAAGMTMRIVPTGTASRGRAAVQDGHGRTSPPASPSATGPGALDLAAPMPEGWKPYDATLAPAPGGAEHHVEIRVQETDLQVAPGVRKRMWTFGGTVPGPVLRGKVGDVFVVTFINDGSMGHGIDFHAGALAPDRPMRTIQPGERLTYRFTAEHAGAWLYHCSTMPMTQHIGNGMYGAVIIDPPDLGEVDREYLLVQGELYLGEPGSAAQVAKMREGRPDGWMFNGTAGGYDHAPLTATAGERVRIWVVAAGPSSGTGVHVVGAPFDTVYKEGAYTLRREEPGGAQVLDLAPAQGGFAELVFPEAGHYPLVDHDMHRAEAGAHGMFEVSAR
ncbi:multicopper oxidase domain-containing protein [Thermostaphylospora chromogena]|uniref:Copper-containing nitrite reductase n=1 Tax=Thermostaphylospora chromogena TaxID=35622 RepID=A0A1H1DTY7_9ACTN|nr:multicopper oxidase domain-containing protein [Thermostaphylospora chromogena]SDQ79729.1 nitrite reductase (NO-forming) [Thermostaphylospora chromogena]